MEGPPEAVIDAAASRSLVEFFLRAPFESLPGLQRRMLLLGQGLEHARAVWKEKGIAYVEENVAAFRHESILPTEAVLVAARVG